MYFFAISRFNPTRGRYELVQKNTANASDPITAASTLTTNQAYSSWSAYQKALLDVVSRFTVTLDDVGFTPEEAAEFRESLVGFAGSQQRMIPAGSDIPSWVLTLLNACYSTGAAAGRSTATSTPVSSQTVVQAPSSAYIAPPDVELPNKIYIYINEGLLLGEDTVRRTGRIKFDSFSGWTNSPNAKETDNAGATTPVVAGYTGKLVAKQPQIPESTVGSVVGLKVYVRRRRI